MVDDDGDLLLNVQKEMTKSVNPLTSIVVVHEKSILSGVIHLIISRVRYWWE